MKRWRFWTITSFLAILFLTLTFRYAFLAINPNNHAKSETKHIERGPILDRTGRILAVQTDLYNLAVWKPELNPSLYKTELIELATLLEESPTTLEKKIDTSSSDYLFLKKRLSQSAARYIKDLHSQGKLTGFMLESSDTRTYPEKDLASNLLGFVGDEKNALAGIELAYESELLPKEDALPWVDGNYYGNQVFLTIDANIQYTLEQIVKRSVEENKAESAMLIAMAAKTGEILGYAMAPSFDPNQFYSYKSESFTDLVSQNAYEPGSVFKIFSIASLLQLGTIDEHSTFECNGTYEHKIEGQSPIIIKCQGVHGTISPLEILKYSCNSGAAYASDTVTNIDFYSSLRAFGFGDRTGLGLPGETPGRLATVDSWSLRTKPTIAFGQEILVSGIQIASAATAIANKGKLLKPYIVKKVLSHDGKIIYENQPITVRQVINEDTATKILDFMETASSDTGSGKRAKIDDIRMSVKTGTAQLIDTKTHKYSDTDFIASCIAIFPTEDPELIVYMVINKPKGDSYFGGKIAAPAVREASDALATLLDLGRGRINETIHSGSITVSKPQIITIGSVMPNLVGTSKRNLQGIFARTDLIFQISGEGWVISQSPAAGTELKAGDTIVLELK